MSTPAPPAERWYLISHADAERVCQLVGFVAGHRGDRTQPVEARSLAGYAGDALRRLQAGLVTTDATPDPDAAPALPCS